MELTLKQKTAFGIGAVGKDMVYALSASYVMYYYQDVLGLSASFVGVVLMAARFFDAFNDPFMGVLVAKTRTRWGRFRPWIFSGTLLNALVLYALFAAPVLDEAALMGDLFQIDDGWEPKVGDWLETDAQKFPHGLKGMVEEIHATGFQAGLWLAPFVCEKDSALFRQHPDWLLKVEGKPWCCGSNWSSFYALDIDNPAVLDYLRRVFDRVLNDWGFDLVKLDFLYGAAPFGNAHESRAARMYRAMELLRSWCGQKQILGCGVPVMPAFGLVDYCRVSCDVSLDWNDVWYMRLFHRERVSTKQAINNTVFRRQLNGRAYGSDPDVFFLREENCKLTAEQKRTLATVNGLLGNVFLTSDMPSHYTDAQRAEYRRLRTLFEHATQVQAEAENDRLHIRYLLDGTPQKLCFDLF